MLQKYYDHCFIFLKQIEGEYPLLFQYNDDWESFHLKFLLYYLVRFRIRDEKDFPILVTAIESDIDIFLTGDKDFLALKDIKKPKMMTMTEYLEKTQI